VRDAFWVYLHKSSNRLNIFSDERTRTESPLQPGASVAQSERTTEGEPIVHADLALRMLADMFWTGLLVCLPVLGLTMLVGLAISILQVVTQVQEASLTFVPKLVTAAMALVVFGPWILRQLASFTKQLWSGIPLMF
jgi:flagellar biosynthesis protein FliQ